VSASSSERAHFGAGRLLLFFNARRGPLVLVGVVVRACTRACLREGVLLQRLKCLGSPFSACSGFPSCARLSTETVPRC